MVLFVWSCARNPATGKRELSLVSEQQEIQIGKQADQDIVRSLGLYNDQALQSYVDQLGQKMAKLSERPDLPWTFRVVDDPVVNAFALPGGYIYVTRGILSHLGSEAELAGVIGHEIGHVTARHSAQRITSQQLGQLGFGLGMIFVPELREYGGLISGGMQLLFLKFGRDDESQADELGLRYMTQIGQNPREMIGVFEMLENVSAQAGTGGRVPEWLATHPDPENRQEAIAAVVDTMKGDLVRGTVNREEYLRRLDGVIYGQNPQEGFFKGSTFHHPALKFSFTFPEGWQTINQKEAVGGVSPEKDAAIQITLASKPSVEEAAREFFAQEGVKSGGMEQGNINGLAAARGEFGAQTQQGNVRGMVTFLEYDGRIYQVLAYSPEQKWSSYQQAARSSVSSFNRLTDERLLSVKPMRLKLTTLDRAMTIEEFARQSSSPVSAEELALINQVEKGERLSAGTLVKQVVGEKL